MHKVIVVEAKKCTGCRVCELICSFTKEKVFSPSLSRIHVVNIEPFIDVALTCRFCEDPQCVRVCPTNALRLDEEKGVITVNENKCIGCAWCVERCDFGVITLHPSKKSAIMVCDLCRDMDKPPCVEFCPPKALQLSSLDAISRKKKVEIVKKLEAASGASSR
jgi:Fe-S-cluster-containing hydrogenase component 2